MNEWEAKVRAMVPKWEALDGLSKLPVIKISFIWIIVVPFAVKFVGWLPSSMDLPFLGVVNIKKFEIPFVWQLFYCGAVFASLARMIYLIKCPTIIKRYKSIIEFKADGRTDSCLKSDLLELLDNNDTDEGRRVFVNNLNQISENVGGVKLFDSTNKMNAVCAISELAIPDIHLARVFWHTRAYANECYWWWRVGCSFMYAISLSLLGAMLAMNFKVMISYILK